MALILAEYQDADTNIILSDVYIRIIPESLIRNVDKWSRVDPFFSFEYEVWKDKETRQSVNKCPIDTLRCTIVGLEYDTFFSYEKTQEEGKDELKQAYSTLKERLKVLNEDTGEYVYPSDDLSTTLP